MNAVEIDGVTKTFGAHVAVDDLSLEVPDGTVYGFIGPNGSGKTTTMRMIVNILYPDAGSIRVLGDRIRGTITDQIAYMPEERGLYKRMKVRQLLRFYGSLKNGRDTESEVDRWLERFELSEWAGKKVDTLSKGMSQKVQFIAAVVSRPRLLILDEPFTGLDPVNADVIRQAVLDIRKQGATIILSTHDMSVAERMCDFIFMIFRGRKVLDGTLEDIQAAYGNDTIRVRTEDGGAALGDVEGVDKVGDFGLAQELRVSPGVDPHEVLTSILTRTRLQSFEIAKPSLHDIFVRIAGPEAREASRQDANAIGETEGKEGRGVAHA